MTSCTRVRYSFTRVFSFSILAASFSGDSFCLLTPCDILTRWWWSKGDRFDLGEIWVHHVDCVRGDRQNIFLLDHQYNMTKRKKKEKKADFVVLHLSSLLSDSSENTDAVENEIESWEDET